MTRSVEEKLDTWKGIALLLGLTLFVIVLIWSLTTFRAEWSLRYDTACEQKFGCGYRIQQINPSDTQKDVQLIECVKPDWNTIESETKMMYVDVIFGHDKWGNINYGNILNVQCRSVGDNVCWR